MANLNQSQGQRKPQKHPPDTTTNLDTLVHLRKAPATKPSREGILYNRARSNTIKNVLTFRLIDLHSENERAYWRMYRCTQLIYQDGYEMTTRYCNNRFCIVCGRIRTAKAMNAYMAELKAMEELRFVTLTIKAVRVEDFQDAVRGMQSTFRRILDKQRKRGAPMRGIRKLEANYNEKAGTYNPHFHILMEGEAEAQTLLAEWLERYPQNSKDAQSIENADEATVIELFKYFTKIFKEEDGRFKIHPRAMDDLYTNLKGRRTFQPFGGVRAQTETDKTEEVIEQFREELENEIQAVWLWSDEQTDWIDFNTGQCLTGYTPDKDTRRMRRELRKK